MVRGRGDSPSGGLGQPLQIPLVDEAPNRASVHRVSALACTQDDLFTMAATYTAVINQDGPWWVGWVEEVPGVNAQERSRDALLASLRVVLREALEFNRQEARQAAGPSYEELAFTL